MAAPSSKESPSNQKMHESGYSDENRLKDPPPSSLPSPLPPASDVAENNIVAAAAAAAATSGASPPLPPSYKKSETSESCVLAKQLLNADNFEEALTVIEEELIKTTTEIRASMEKELVSLGSSSTTTTTTTTTNNKDADLETEIDLHEALAPLHYLYGTTLLYSLEEAKDDGNDNGAMMMTEAGAKASTTATTTPATEAASLEGRVSPDPTNPWAHLSGPSESANASASVAPQIDNNNSNVDDAANATAEDIQIAWENLEAARTIVEKMLGNMLPSQIDFAKLQLDLAQIHLREGDLQRINGNYTSAVGDYSSCLEILLRHNHTKDEQNNLRDLNRKIADTQFNLGLTYLTSSSDLQKEVAGANDNANPSDAAANNASATADQREKAALLARDHCQKGIQQHVDCAKTFCTIVARLCGVDPQTILVTTTDNETADAAPDSAKKPAAGFKTTGLDDKNDDTTTGPSSSTATSATADASQTLNVWRKAVATMVASHTPSDTQDLLRVSDILQVLDEIQETIDEAERSQEGVFQAAEIRVKAQQAAAAQDGGAFGAAEVVNPDGSTTTIGFGQGATSTAATANATSDAGASKPTAVDAIPMMVVKKKKKRKDIGEGSINEEGESKKTSSESDSNKRTKAA